MLRRIAECIEVRHWWKPALRGLVRLHVPLLPIMLVLLNVPVSSLRFVEATRGARLMLSSFAPFVLFMPTLVAFFPAYSIQRFDIATWAMLATGIREHKGVCLTF